MIAQQILWIETLLKLGAGLPLLLAPTGLLRALGLPPAASAFWPRLLAVTLVGMGAAAFIEGARPGVGGLGLVGCATVNASAAGALAAQIALSGDAASRRGRVTLWTLAVILGLLAALEIIVAGISDPGR
ncbi:MAG: hypothetical protein R3D31_02640 [Hyphomicrobiaceae bacterium]